MMKKQTHYKIKDLYVGYIALQSNVKIEYVSMAYSWTYTPIKVGIFITTIKGYKHILTNTYYKKASHKTPLQPVIVEKNTHAFSYFHPNLASELIKNNTPYLTRELIEKLEDMYTKDMLEVKSSELNK